STMVYVTHDQLEALSMGDKIGVLRKGRLEQLGTADEIYNSPRNLFVARFIGNPMMNTIAIDEIKGCSLIWKGNSTPIAGRYLDSVKDRMDAKVLLGVRAEHICLEGSRWASVAAPTELVGATVQRVELAGDQKFITLDADGIKLTTRCEPDLTIRNGDEVRFWFDAEQLHIFDAENGRSLLTEENV
ncbi:MAG: TOBE domain-containing protein, partial [Pyrinomonadaceae bacterium]